jgi:hypothetical protein
VKQNIVIYEGSLHEIHTTDFSVKVPTELIAEASNYSDFLICIENWAKHFGFIGRDDIVAQVVI